LAFSILDDENNNFRVKALKIGLVQAPVSLDARQERQDGRQERQDVDKTGYKHYIIITWRTWRSLGALGEHLVQRMLKQRQF
jgi:hypothetical protein